MNRSIRAWSTVIALAGFVASCSDDGGAASEDKGSSNSSTAQASDGNDVAGDSVGGSQPTTAGAEAGDATASSGEATASSDASSDASAGASTGDATASSGSSTDGPATGDAPDCSGDGPSEGAPGPDPALGFQPDVKPTGWGDLSEGGIDNPGGPCPGDGGTPMLLPTTGIEYCVKATPACKDTCGCPLYITLNTEGAFFKRADDVAANGELITVELYVEFDGDKIKDKIAELPRIIAHDYPGLDRQRVYAIGWSAGVGGVSRALCHISKKSDLSPLGTTSDIYAAVVALGGCACTSDYVQLSGNLHNLAFNGMDDIFGGGGCEDGMRQRAMVNGCANPDATWAPLPSDHPYAKNGDGSSNAEILDFGPCDWGSVLSVRGLDEGHVLSFKKHFDPKISGYDTAWNFLQGKVKHD